MTVNIEELINRLGKSYNDLVDSELVIYKSRPRGASGSPIISLDMAREGVFLSFWRDGRILKDITLTLQDDEATDWIFPNELPAPLEKKMTRSWVHARLREPLRSLPPVVVMKREFGWIDLYKAEGRPIPTSMQINHDMMDRVMSVTFMPTSELRW